MKVRSLRQLLFSGGSGSGSFGGSLNSFAFGSYYFLTFGGSSNFFSCGSNFFYYFYFFSCGSLGFGVFSFGAGEHGHAESNGQHKN